jgi:hypothetical protein
MRDSDALMATFSGNGDSVGRGRGRAVEEVACDQVAAPSQLTTLLGRSSVVAVSPPSVGTYPAGVR